VKLYGTRLRLVLTALDAHARTLPAGSADAVATEALIVEVRAGIANEVDRARRRGRQLPPPGAAHADLEDDGSLEQFRAGMADQLRRQFHDL
jgi:hypothetical protein